jgi:hypothetical protein
MNLGKYWEVLTKEEKRTLLWAIQIHGKNRRHLHLGMLPFISRYEAARCYALSHSSMFMNLINARLLLKKLGVVDMAYHTDSESVWIEFDGPVRAVEVIPYDAEVYEGHTGWNAPA